MNTLPLVPRYGQDTLADLVPSVAHHLGLDGFADSIEVPHAERYVLVLIDGLGQQLLQGAAAHAPHLASLLPGSATLMACAPSSTACSLASLGTGLVPGQHGIFGYTFREPHADQVMNALTWHNGPDDVLAFQPRRTMFELAERAGVAVSSVAPARFKGSGLTLAGLRGGHFAALRSEESLPERVSKVTRCVRRGEKSFVYVYERQLDHTGHSAGCNSYAWQGALAEVDERVAALRDALDDDVCILVTGDHGMVDVPWENQIVAEYEPGLFDGWRMMGGEGRFRQLYTDHPVEVAARWSEVLGDKAWVLTGDEAVGAGWFGAMDERCRPRLGDVVVAMRDNWAVMTADQPGEMSLVGQHGSLTREEMLVPLLVDHPASRN